MKKTLIAAGTAGLAAFGLGTAAQAQTVRVQAPFVDVGVDVPGVRGNAVDVRALRGRDLAGVRVGNVADVRVGGAYRYNDDRYDDDRRNVRYYEPRPSRVGYRDVPRANGVKARAAYENGYEDGYQDGRADGEAIRYSDRDYRRAPVYQQPQYGYRGVPAQYGVPSNYGYYNNNGSEIATYIGVATQLLNAFAAPQY